MKESEIQKKIQDALKARGAYVFKVITANRSGVPDIIACYRSKFIGIEVKGPKGVVSAIQEKNVRMILAAGGHASVAKTVNEVMQVLEDIDNARYD